MEVDSPGLAPEFAILELFKLGDAVYSWALLAALQARAGGRSGILIAPRLCGALPLYRTKSSFIPIDAPWLERGWLRKPLALAAGINSSRNKIKKVPRDCTVIGARGALIEQLLLLGHRRKIWFAGSTGTVRQRVLGLPKIHPFRNRENALRVYFRTPDLQLRWPFLADGYGRVTGEKHLVLCPEAGSAAREWPIGSWQSLLTILESEGWRCTLVHTEARKDEAIATAGRGRTWSGGIDEFGKLLSMARAVIAVDSFAGHFAAAIGVPVLTLFGPQSAAVWKPWGMQNLGIQSAAAESMRFDRNAYIEAIGPKLMRDIHPNAVAKIFRLWIAGDMQWNGRHDSGLILW